MHFEMMRDKSRDFPEVEDPEKFDSAMIWFCKYKIFNQISRFVNLKKLKIAGFPESDFECLGNLQNLEVLEVVHFPNITDLLPFAKLRKLISLHLATLPSWDVSGKIQKVQSLDPISELPSLIELSLFGVVPTSKDISRLLENKNLKTVEISKYPKDLTDKIKARFPKSN